MNTCLNCNKEVTNKYCGTSCQNSHRGQKALEKYNSSPKKCKNCSATLNYFQRLNDFCSHSCAAILNNQQRIGQKKEKTVSPKVIKKDVIGTITKKELFSLRSNWQSARSAIQKRARKEFFKSNKKECTICGYTNHVEVAHIKAVSQFSDNSTIDEINHISNLIGLCPNHHWEFDNGLINLQ